MTASSRTPKMPSTTSAPRRSACRALALVGLCLLPGLAAAAPIAATGTSASSVYPPADGNSYDAKHVIDGKASTAWVEGDEGSGMGSWVQLAVPAGTEVASIKVWGGMWYSAEQWDRSNRPKQLEAEFSDGSTHMIDLPDSQSLVEVKLPSPVKTDFVKLKIKGIHSGSTWSDTAISEVQLFDTKPGGPAIRNVTSSTTAPNDGESYEATRVADGLSDTMWCEGNKEGDGTGEWIELDLGGKSSVSTLSVINGIGTSMVFWFKGNRAESATLTFDDGSTQTVAIKNTFKKQDISFSPVTTGKVKITFDKVAKGKEFNDLCISEASVR